MSFWKKRLPKREEILNSRLIRPFAHYFGHGSLWHMNRRSVARGVAIGMFFAFMTPVAQTVFAALALINLLMVIGVLIGAPESLPVDQRRPSGFKVLAASTASVLRNRHYLGYTLTVALVAGAMFAYIAASPFVLQNIIGLGPRAYAFTFGACALAIAAGSMGSARIVGRFGPRRVLMGGVLAAVVIAALQLLNVTIGGVTPGVTIDRKSVV